ncbi:MAG: helix-turn-helix domain-containing protein [Lachnospiraceae bacterium]|nr:helix-turn-helix domain-containing protein [Lachnospiraceae bacterium]
MLTVKNLREKSGMSQKQFADYFEIPIRTIQSWEQNLRTPPNYIAIMMEKILKYENKIV